MTKREMKKNRRTSKDFINTTDDIFRALHHRILSKEEEAELARRLLGGDKKSGETLVLHNLKLCMHWAFKFAKATGKTDQVQDMFHEAVMVLVRGLPEFRPDMGRLSTFLGYRIRVALSRYLNKGARIITVPHAWSHAITKSILDAIPILVLPDKGHTHTEPDVVDSEKRRMILETLPLVLDPKEADIIKLRFGLNEKTGPMSLEMVGKLYKLSRERIRQIEMRALLKLRQPLYSRPLKDFVEE